MNWRKRNIFRMKQCVVCGTEFRPTGGYQHYCSGDCRKERMLRNGVLTSSYQYANISGDWRKYFNRIRHRTGARSMQLTVDDLLKLHAKQEGKCALSGVEMTCILVKGERTWTNASVDRIKAGGPYTQKNVQLVCTAVNIFRGMLPLQDYIMWCKRVAKHSGKNMTERVRDYKKEYSSYHAKPEQVKKRAMRNMARRELEKEGRVHKGDGKDVDHKKPLRAGGTNAKGNLRVTSVGKNRGWRKGQ